MLSGTSDFFGLNHYTTELAEYGVFTGETSYDKDQDLFKTQDPAWPSSAANWLKVIKFFSIKIKNINVFDWVNLKHKVVPWGFRKVLNWIKTEYNNKRLIVTENGFADIGGVDDVDRSNYYTVCLHRQIKCQRLIILSMNRIISMRC